MTEDNVLDEHALDLDTPASGNIFDNFSNRLSNLLAAFNDVLQDTGTNDVAEGGLSALNEGLANVGNAKSGLVWADNVVVDDRGQVEIDIVLGHADLLRDFNNLNLDVDLDDALREGVDLDETGVDGLVEAAKLGDETDVALVDVLIRVGAADTARNGSQGSNAGA